MGTIAFALVVWFMRRPDQLLHPYVWDEEYQVLNRYQNQGLLHALFAPINGYLLWPTTMTVGATASADFRSLPSLEYWLSTGWFIATVVLILLPASRLRLSWRVLFVVFLVLAPMNPEVFGIADYIFWWTTLWPLVTILWSKDYWWLRLPVLLVGGMSSLAGAAMVIPYAVLFMRTRQRRYLVGTIILGLCSAIQAAVYFTSDRSVQAPLHPRGVTIQVLRNFSDYAVTWLKPTSSEFLAFAGGCLVLAVLGTVGYQIVRHRSAYASELIALTVALFVVSVLSAIPAPLVSDPSQAGPRYYFLPFVVLSWVLILVIVTSDIQWARIGATVVVVMSLFALSENFSRHEDAVSWSHQLEQCRTATNTFSVPVQFDGVRADMWKGLLQITPATCRRLGL